MEIVAIHNVLRTRNLPEISEEIAWDVEEKIDGSFLTWWWEEGGGLVVRSKNNQLNLEDPPDLFAPSVHHLRILPPQDPGLVFTGEALKGRKHNTIMYGRAPLGNIVLFDVWRGVEPLADLHTLPFYALAMGIEHTSHLGRLRAATYEDLIRQIAETRDHVVSRMPSILGGEIEGIVVKARSLFYRPTGHQTDHPLYIKAVSERFKEVHKSNPEFSGTGGKVEALIKGLATPARWNKARQHLAEQGVLTGEMSDIPLLMKEVGLDLAKEETDYIKEELFKIYWKEISRAAVKGLPEWYRDNR